MALVYVGNLDPRTTKRELEGEFRVYGVIRSIWIARRPPGYCFIDFDDRGDAKDAIRGLNGKHGWRVELSHRNAEDVHVVGGRGRDGCGSSDLNCYRCGEPGHFARACRTTIGSGGQESGHRRSPSPRFHRSPSYGMRSYSPCDGSPRHQSSSSRSSRRSRSYSSSPSYHNGNGSANERRQSRSRS